MTYKFISLNRLTQYWSILPSPENGTLGRILLMFPKKQYIRGICRINVKNPEGESFAQINSPYCAVSEFVQKSPP